MQFWCPGCECAHGVRVFGEKPVWSWNGDIERPTITPSILARYYRATPEGAAMMLSGEALPPGTDRYPGMDMICHSFVTAGKIQFLDDCTHDLRGKTVDLPAWTEVGT